MLLKSLSTLLLLGVALSRTIEIHIHADEDGISFADRLMTPVSESSTANCYWDGTSPFCAGGCSGGYSDCGTSSCGDGACCVTGYKKYCCRGGCPNVALHQQGSDHMHSQDKVHKQDGDNDDICNGEEFLCCPPAASRNRECKCINKDKAPKSLKASKQKVLHSMNEDLCKEGQTVCCNPGAESNEECACIDE